MPYLSIALSHSVPNTSYFQNQRWRLDPGNADVEWEWAEMYHYEESFSARGKEHKWAYTQANTNVTLSPVG